MQPSGRSGDIPLAWLAPVLVAAAILASTGLGRQELWDDESLAAIVAKNFAETGELTGWDGRNLLAYRDGSLLDDRLRSINPPLEAIVVGAAFRLLGASTWAARLPSVVARILALALLALVVRRELGARSPAWLYAAAYLGGSVGFLLNVRQCRYYALALLFATALYGAYREALRAGRVLWWLAAAAAATALFYTHYLICAAFVAATGITFLVVDRREVGRRELWKPAVGAAAFLAAALPHAIARAIWNRPDIYEDGLPWAQRKLALVWWNLRDLSQIHVVPWILGLAVVGLALGARRTAPTRALARWATILVAFALFVALLSPQPVGLTTAADVRYLLPALAFASALFGWALSVVSAWSKLAALGVLALALSSSLFSWVPGGAPPRWLLPAFVVEILRPYPTSYGEAIRYLEAAAKPEEKVYAHPEHANYPLMFQLGGKLRFCCALGPGSRLLAGAAASLDAPLARDRDLPDWIVTFGLDPEPLEHFSRRRLRDVGWQGLSYEPAAVLDVYYLDTWRPELMHHAFAPVTSFDRRTEAVYVFRRRGASP